VGYLLIPSARHLPAWRADGAAAMALLHAGPVEFLYYWFHRALHHHFLYSRYHSHHHSSIVTEPITCKCCLAASVSVSSSFSRLRIMYSCRLFEAIQNWFQPKLVFHFSTV